MHYRASISDLQFNQELKKAPSVVAEKVPEVFASLQILVQEVLVYKCR